MEKLKPSDYYFRYLKEKYPGSKDYFMIYDEGGYYNRSTTTFYNDDGKELEVKDNGYYG